MSSESFLKDEIRRRVIYPLVIGVLMIGSGIIATLVIGLQLTHFLSESAKSPFLTTRIVINTGIFWAEKWHVVTSVLLAAALIFWACSKTKKGKKALGTLFLRLPVISSITKKVNITRTIKKLNLLLNSGTPLARSLEIISKETGNFYYTEAIAAAAEKVRAGEKLSAALKPYPKLFPMTIVQMIEVGEATGETLNILKKAGDFFEGETVIDIRNLAAVIERILLLIIGGLVGFFVASVIQPLILFVF